MHPRYLEYLYRAAKEACTEVSSCPYIRTSTSEITDALKPFAFSSLSPEAFWQKDRTNALIAPAKLFKLSLLSGVRFPVGKLHEDEFTTYQILFQCDTTAVLVMPLYYYYFNSTSITHTEWHPRRLDGLDALNAQVRYFQQNNFPAACRVSAAHLLQHCIKHVMYIKHLSPKYDYLLRDVRTRRRRAFRLYAGNVGFRKAVSYWYEVQIKTPAKRVLGTESVFSFIKRRIKKKLRF